MFQVRNVATKFRMPAVMLNVVLSLAAAGANAAKPEEATESALDNCEFIGKVEGSSGYGKNFGWQPIAKQYALQSAEKAGATHVVWQRFIPVGAFNGIAVARAYACNKSRGS